MTYKQLTREQKYHIYVLMKAGLCQAEIAKIIGVHKSTISREMLANVVFGDIALNKLIVLPRLVEQKWLRIESRHVDLG